MGFGPTTSTLARLRSTPELYPHRAERVIKYHILKKMQALISIFFIFFATLRIYAQNQAIFLSLKRQKSQSDQAPEPNRNSITP